MAEAYYEPTPATDGATMNPVPGAVFQVFEIADTAFATPLSLRVGSGNPTTTVAASETLATLPGVYVTSDNFEHIWKSGTFEWRRDSIDGAKKAIEAAKLAASNSASDSDASAVSAANSAQAAQDAAALVDAPADTTVTALINGSTQTSNALDAKIVTGVDEQLPVFTEEKIRLDALAAGKRLNAITAGNRSVPAQGVTVGALVAASTASAIPSALRVYAYERANTRVNPALRILGTRAVQADANFPRYDYIRPDPTIVTYAPGALTGTSMKFDVQYNGTKIDVLIRRSGGSVPHIISVDGLEARTVTEAELIAAGVGAGSLARVPLTFPDARRRVISYTQRTASCEFPGFDIEPAYPLAYPTGSFKGPKVLIAGDSFTEGSGAGTEPGFADWVSWHMGWPDVWKGGSGSTGYQQDGSRQSLVDRYQNDIINQAPDILIIALGINDNAQWNTDPAPVIAAAVTVWDAVIAALPNAEIIVVGPFWPRTVQPTEVIDDMDAQFAALVKARGLRYISPVAEGWITGTGKVGATKGDGNADLYISSDGTHPSAEGHKYIGWRLAGHLSVPHVPAP